MNVLEFNATLIRKGYTKQTLADKMDINVTTLLRKLDGTSDFKAYEIRMIKDLLNLTAEEVTLIFFAD